ncbi:uncharacterized protein [Ptychodera flava]|uniref:uncharacterized protein n=1 Tax=Ptychodera flava TaxID=63121 RepID=UPI00396AACF1
MVEGDILNSHNWNNCWPNLPEQERISLQKIRNRDDIVIKPADKGGSIVVMDSDWYISECKKQLNDTKFYEKLASDPTEEYTLKLQKKITRWRRKNWISNKTARKLLPQEPKPGHFYGLPKIHKKDNPLRPIVPQCQSLTTPLSMYVDYYLQPIVQSLPSYIKDTNHHLQDINQINIPDNALLVTLDVQSLYTNIPHDFGINSVREFLTMHNVENTDLLIEMLQFILEHNFFTFQGNFYLQKHGTAMGSKVAPSYANLAMGKIENTILHNTPLQPTQWRRFIDDVRFIWIHGLSTLLKFHQHCNEVHPTIKFTIEHSSKHIAFLDTDMSIQNNSIHTSIYSKPTDKHPYLWPTSCHPNHTFNSVIWSQTLRYRRICSDTSTYDKATKEMTHHFAKRGYKPQTVKTYIEKARNIERNHFLTTKPTDKPQHKRNPFVTTFNPTLPKISNIIHRHWGIISEDKEINKAIPEVPITAFRQPPNLRKILVRADLKKISHQPTTGETKRFGNCNQCQFITETNTITSSTTGKTHNIIGKISCNTRNLIYIITCQKCSKQYIGETKRELKRRIYEHIYTIRSRKPTPVSEHFNQLDHSPSHFQATGLHKVHTTNTRKRRLCEQKYIVDIDTLTPRALTKEKDKATFPRFNFPFSTT